MNWIKHRSGWKNWPTRSNGESLATSSHFVTKLATPTAPPSLEEEKGEVEKEWNRMPKKEELDQSMRELQRQIDELKDEISLVPFLHRTSCGIGR